MQETIAPYTALALQMDCTLVHGLAPGAARQQMHQTVERIGDMVAAAAGFTRGFNGTETRLVVLPEYVLTGFPMGESLEQWRDLAAIAPEGPEYAALAAIARRQRCYLAGNAYEVDPHFPDLYFQVCFIIAPSGEVILRYRRLISLFAPTPVDVWEKYLEVYGLEAVFPVARTEIGNLACIASEEILYPEIARALAIRGAELFCHATSETGAPGLTSKEIARRARAIENMAYVVAANTARLLGSSLPKDSTGGMSKVVDHKGAVLAEAYPGETFTANAVIDIAALRRTRSLPGMTNLLSRQPLEVYTAAYEGKTISPANTFLKDGRVSVPNRAFFIERQAAVIAKMKTSGVI